MRKPRFIWLFGFVVSAILVQIQLHSQGVDTPAFSPLPSDLPPTVAPPRPRPANPNLNPATRVFTPPGRPPAPLVARAAPITMAEGILAFDSVSKEFNAKTGELTAPFMFALTNVSKTNVIVNWVRPSCGCTVAKLPPVPWNLAPGDSGTIELSVDLRGKYGTLAKYVMVDTSQGQKTLNIKVHIPTGANALAPAGVDSRTRNMQLAMADRQIVFRNDCASCHATPAIGKTGQPLYAAACAICHDAPHRATMVPDLKALKVPTSREYWLHWIANGKPGTLMPAFAKQHGGPLTDEQIQSLADYLVEFIPAKPPTKEVTAKILDSAPPLPQ